MLSVIGICLIIVGFYGNWVTKLYTLKKLEDTLEYLNKNNDENNRIKHNEISQKTKIIISLSPLFILIGIFLLFNN
ncbi:hypothetical protein [Brassicibacter mesophilus]|uniref:hypothetical protein n=1 Tax=Brassicibacter mesophilus TaxID=745119 RepID=UPI003D1F5699